MIVSFLYCFSVKSHFLHILPYVNILLLTADVLKKYIFCKLTHSLWVGNGSLL